MSDKRTIQAKDIVQDILSDKTDLELMEKYKLTSRGLQSIFSKLAAAGMVTPEQISARTPAFDDTVNIECVRLTPREKLVFPMPVYPAETPSARGIVHDITELGVGVTGIFAAVGETHAFVIPADEFFRVPPVRFTALCVWAGVDDERGVPLAGFKVIEVHEGDLGRLQLLIQSLTRVQVSDRLD